MSQQEVILKYWPHNPQMKFHKARYQSRYRLVSAGTGGGKTYAGVFEDFAWMLDNPGIEGIIFEPTYAMIKRILLRETLEKPEFFGRQVESHPLVHEFHKTEMRLDLINGSRVWFIGLDNPEAAEGSSIDFAHVDEGRLVPKFQEAWESIVRRLRGSGRGSFPCGAWVTTTPPPPSSYMFDFFENPRTKDPQASVYRWSLLENIYLDEEYKQSMLRTHKGGLAEVFIYGRFANVGVGSFSFDYTRHVVGESNCPVKVIPELKNISYGVDFGWTNPSCILVVGFDGDGRAYVLDEFYQSRVQLETLVEEAVTFNQTHGSHQFLCDRSEPMAIDKLRMNGARAVGAKSMRDEGIMELGGRFHDAGDGKPRIFIKRSCVNLISELQVYDEAKKENDHAVDALRYALEASRGGRPSAVRGVVY